MVSMRKSAMLYKVYSFARGSEEKRSGISKSFNGYGMVREPN